MSTWGEFSPVPVDQLYAETPEAIEWVVEDYLPVGSLTALVAFPKVGKTTLAYALVAAVAHGEPFIDRPVKQGAVLILAVEEHPRDVMLRLKKFGVIAGKDQVFVHRSTLTPSPENRARITDFIKRHNVRLVVLDTITHHWDVKDENDNAVVLRALKPWLDLARQTGAAVVLIHHEGKSNEVARDGRSMRGASSFAGVVDQILTLARATGAQRSLYSNGRYDQTPRAVTLELVESTYVVVDAAIQDQENRQEKILAFLRMQPDHRASAATIVDGTGLPRSTCFRLLAAMKKTRLVKSEQGAWILVEAPVSESQSLRVDMGRDSVSRPVPLLSESQSHEVSGQEMRLPPSLG